MTDGAGVGWLDGSLVKAGATDGAGVVKAGATEGMTDGAGVG